MITDKKTSVKYLLRCYELSSIVYKTYTTQTIFVYIYLGFEGIVF